MKMTEFLEKDKERLLTEIAAAPEAEKAVRILENETDKLLLKYNEKCDSDRERDTAAYLMQAVRLALPLIDSSGSARVWERETGKGEEKKARIGVPAILLLLAGLAFLVYGLIPIIMTILSNADTAARNDTLMRGASILIGTLAVFIAGNLFHRPVVKRSKEHHVEIRVDADKIYRSYRNMILSVDQSLAEVDAKERWDKREQAGNIDGRQATTPEIDLFADLLAASYSRDPEYALEKIDEIKYFLHRQQIEVIDYSESTKQYFDLMPGAQGGTIRPALIADGNVLKKGLASKGR